MGNLTLDRAMTGFNCMNASHRVRLAVVFLAGALMLGVKRRGKSVSSI